jgi:hypothetical protein
MCRFIFGGDLLSDDLDFRLAKAGVEQLFVGTQPAMACLIEEASHWPHSLLGNNEGGRRGKQQKQKFKVN